MKPISALILATVGGVATFAVQNELFPARVHAAPFAVPNTPDWRRQAIDSYPGGAKVDHIVARLSDRLDLTRDQAKHFRALLDRQREETLALLVAGPPNLSRDQFIARRHQMWMATRKRLDALLSNNQLAIFSESKPPA